MKARSSRIVTAENEQQTYDYRHGRDSTHPYHGSVNYEST